MPLYLTNLSKLKIPVHNKGFKKYYGKSDTQSAFGCLRSERRLDWHESASNNVFTIYPD